MDPWTTGPEHRIANRIRVWWLHRAATRVSQMSEQIYENILKRVQQFDDDARISSISRRDADDGILVRLATSARSNSMVKAIREAWPLASVSLVENLVDGSTEAQVLLPDEAEQQALAKGIAASTTWQEPLRKVANVLVALLAIACVHKVVEISRE